MSRICVKGLPKTLTDTKLREFFGTKGEITDAKVVKTQSGKSRLFGFVGYRTDEQAIEALKYFDNTFLGTSKIKVELAKKIGDPFLNTASLSKHTKKKIAKDAKRNAAEQAKLMKPIKPPDKSKVKSSMSQEKMDFLEAMKPRKQAKAWANDESGVMQALEQIDQVPILDEDSMSDESDETGSVNDLTHQAADDDDILPLSAQPMSDLDFLRSKVKKSISSQVSQISDEGRGDSDFHLDSAVNALEKKQVVSNRQNGTPGDSSKAGASSHEVTGDDDDAPDQTDNQQGTMTEEGEDEENGRLFVRNLPFTASEEEINALFAKFGPITEVHLPLDADKRSKGFGFVQFMIPEHSTAAMTTLDGTSFQGRLLHIIKAKEKKQEPSALDSAMDGKTSTYKQQKEDARKKMAGKRESWNSAYMHSDTIVTALAEKYGVQKSDLLDHTESGGEMAVRMAIGESHVQQENRDFFSQRGVDLRALESHTSGNRASQRSTTTLLVKNLPQDSDQVELEAMFARFGTLSSFLLPPSRAVALADFVEPSEARQAFKGLAYRKYKHLPLYLEWAPLGIIDKSKAEGAAAAAAGASSTASKPTQEMNSKKTLSSSSSRETKAEKTAATESLDDDYSTLFIKNLSFETTSAGLRSHIETQLGAGGAAGGLRTVSLPTKTQGAHNRLLSMGFGFAEFRSAQAAADALQRLQGSLLDGHALQVKPSEKRLSAGAAAGKRARPEDGRQPGTKIAVRNVAFQTTAAELKALFSSFGSIKRVRLPKKMGGAHRGFAFVDFSSAQEAGNAMASLTNTHLYGRHLVLEWAKEDDQELSMATLRKKAKVDEGTANVQRQRRAAAAGVSGDGDGLQVPDMSDAM